MYGYVRPFKGDLKVSEYERFKSVYCGLCHRLREKCGPAARFVVNYDFTFLAMLLSRAECSESVYRRCAASPFRKKCCHCNDAALDAAANQSVILAYWKLRDSVADGGFGERLKSRAAMLLLRRAYRRAGTEAPAFDACVRENLTKLSALERAQSPSLDAAADCFAKILQSAADAEPDESRRRILSQILYHTGRIVYILDAVNDLPEDRNNGNYNPLICRFALSGDELTPESREAVGNTLQLSENMLLSAFELLPEGVWTGILHNILFEGLPAVSTLVMNGKWRERSRIQKEKMNGADL